LPRDFGLRVAKVTLGLDMSVATRGDDV
jgi:hypothetical protein